jgi:hypothetical protein
MTTSPIMRRRTAQLGRPNHASNNAADGDMPNADLSGKRQRTKHRRTRRHDEELCHEQSLAVQRLADHPSNRSDEQHWQASRDRYHGDQKGRVRDVVGEDPGNQQFEPPHRVADPTGKPQANVARCHEKAARSDRGWYRCGSHLSARIAGPERQDAARSVSSLAAALAGASP